MKRIHSITLVILITTFSNSVYAYLDPGAGSFILQMLIAGILGAIYTLKLYWYGLKSFVLRIFGKEIEEPLVDHPNKYEKSKSTNQN